MHGSGGSNNRVAPVPRWLVEERLHDARAARREARRLQDQERDRKQEFMSERARLHCISMLTLETREQAEDSQFLRSRITALEDERDILRRENCRLAGQLQVDQIGITRLENRLARLEDRGPAPGEQLVALVKLMLEAWRSIVTREQRLRLEEITSNHRNLQADMRQLRGLLVSEGRRALGMEAELGRQLRAQVTRLALSSWRALTWHNCRAKLLRRLAQLISMQACMEARAQAEVLRCAYSGWRALAWRTCRGKFLGRIEQLTCMQACMESHAQESTCDRLEAQLRLVEARCRDHEAAAAAAQASLIRERALHTAAKGTAETQRTFASIGIQALPTTQAGPNRRASSSGPRSASASATTRLQKSFGGSCRAPSAPIANGATAGGSNFHQHGQVLERMADLQLQRSRRLASSERWEQLKADGPPLGCGHSYNRCCCCHCCCEHEGCKKEQLLVQLAPKTTARLAADALAAPSSAGR